MRVLDQYVLVEQVMVSKGKKIIVDAARDNKDKFDYSFKIVQLGNKCEREIKIGESPIFSEHVRFGGIKVIEDTNIGMITNIIVHEGDIIAIDDEDMLVRHEEMYKKIMDAVSEKKELKMKPIKD